MIQGHLSVIVCHVPHAVCLSDNKRILVSEIVDKRKFHWHVVHTASSDYRYNVGILMCIFVLPRVQLVFLTHLVTATCFKLSFYFWWPNYIWP